VNQKSVFNLGFKEELQDEGHKHMIEKLIKMADCALNILTFKFNLPVQLEDTVNTDVNIDDIDFEKYIPQTNSSDIAKNIKAGRDGKNDART
jgi:hypothetical protein